MAERLVLNNQAAAHVQAYLEYEAIVGNDDGGKMMSEAEFEAYKARVREKRKNRLYVHWRNMETGQDCKAIGPASQCFCGHRFKEHNFDNVENKKVHCKDKKCKCKMFSYVPIFGSQDFRCMVCKHSCTEHDPNTGKCLRPNCQKKCQAFQSRHACSCGYGYDVHQTVFETRAEREAAGRQVDAAWLQESNMVGGMGGLGHHDFSSLVEDQDKQDMMHPGAIMGNMQMAGQLMGPGMQQQMLEAEQRGGNMIGGAQQRLAIEGASAGSGRGRAAGRGASRQSAAATQDSGALVPAGRGAGLPNLLDLFNTPHSFGGGGGGRGGGAAQITGQMRRLKM